MDSIKPDIELRTRSNFELASKQKGDPWGESSKRIPKNLQESTKKLLSTSKIKKEDSYLNFSALRLSEPNLWLQIRKCKFGSIYFVKWSLSCNLLQRHGERERREKKSRRRAEEMARERKRRTPADGTDEAIGQDGLQ